jgi:hypothetical protein
MATILHSYLVRFTAIASIVLATVRGNLAQERPNPVSVVRFATAGQPLKAQVGRDGTIHLLLDSNDGPLYVKSQDVTEANQRYSLEDCGLSHDLFYG